MRGGGALRPSRTGGRGLTLVELLVTIAIVAVLVSMSVGVLSRLGQKEALEATQMAVRSLLRRAHNAAREERFGVLVELDARGAELRAQQRTSITRFRFEGEPLLLEPEPEAGALFGADAAPPAFELGGARGYTVEFERAELDQGRYGQGALFRYEDADGAAWGSVEDRPALSPLEGVHIECWVYLGQLEERLPEASPYEQPSSRQRERFARAGDAPRVAPARRARFTPGDPPIFYAVRKGRAYALGVTARYEVEVAFTGPNAAGQEVTWISRTRPETLRPYRWHRLAVAYDGRRVEVAVDGIARVHLPLRDDPDGLPTQLIRDRAPLALSDPDPRQAFYGKIDELQLSALIRAQRLPIPAELLLIAPGDAISFDLLGQLDPARHAEPFAFYLTDDPQAWELLAASEEAGGRPAEAAPATTRARPAAPAAHAGAEPANVLLDPAGFRRFEALLPTLDPTRVRRVVVERTGLVSE